jgi:hypothetical protein
MVPSCSRVLKFRFLPVTIWSAGGTRSPPRLHRQDENRSAIYHTRQWILDRVYKGGYPARRTQRRHGWCLTEIRARAVNVDDHGFLWVCEDGTPFQYSGIGKMCRVEAEKWLDIKMAPHRHRHNLATMMADEAPENPALPRLYWGSASGAIVTIPRPGSVKLTNSINELCRKPVLPPVPRLSALLA